MNKTTCPNGQTIRFPAAKRRVRLLTGCLIVGAAICAIVFLLPAGRWTSVGAAVLGAAGAAGVMRFFRSSWAGDPAAALAFENAPLAIWSMDADGVVAAANARARSLLSIGDADSENELSQAPTVDRPMSDNPDAIVARVATISGGHQADTAFEVFADVTAETRFSRSLAQANLRIEVACVGSSEGIWDWDIATSQLWMTPQGYSMLDEEVSAASDFTWWRKRIHDDDAPKLEAALKAHLEGGGVYDVQYRIKNRGGDWRWFRSRGRALRNEQGRPVRMIGTSSDVTELVEARAAAEEASRMKTCFLGSMSYEIRTPINGVAGMLHALRRTDLDADQAKYVDVAERSISSLQDFASQIVEFASIDDSEAQTAASLFSPDEIIARVLKKFASLAAEKSVRMVAGPTESRRYVGDAAAIEAILEKLASNAVRFTDEGEIVVSYKEEIRVSGRTRRLIFTVADTGNGIAAHMVDKVFEPFFQAPADVAANRGGAGLGLALAKRRAASIDAEVALANNAGRGATATLRVPVIEVKPGAIVAQVPNPLQADGRITILAAEDNDLNQFVLKTMLEFHRHELFFVKDGRAAVDAWSEGAFDLILMDIQMPVMDGVAATREIRALEVSSGRQATPIIALTANAMTHQMEEYLAAGADGYVAKPIVEAELLDAIAVSLGRRGKAA